MQPLPIDIQRDNELKTLQYGNNNYAQIYSNNKSDLTTSQIGSYNYMNYDNSFDKRGVKSSISAQGNNNIIDIVGSNSISEKLNLQIKGDNMTIFMRNY